MDAPTCCKCFDQSLFQFYISSTHKEFLQLNSTIQFKFFSLPARMPPFVLLFTFSAKNNKDFSSSLLGRRWTELISIYEQQFFWDDFEYSEIGKGMMIFCSVDVRIGEIRKNMWKKYDKFFAWIFIFDDYKSEEILLENFQFSLGILSESTDFTKLVECE